MVIDDVLVSIVIPFKNTDSNRFRNLCNSIKNSIHRKDEDLVEIVFVNDKSTESNFNELHNVFTDVFNDTDFNIVDITVPESNVGGILQSRLLGIKNSSGRYIWTLDSDDELFPDSLNVLIRYIKMLDVDIIAWRLPEKSDKNESKYINHKTISYEVPNLLDKLTFQNAFFKTREISGYVHCKAVRRDLINKSMNELVNTSGYINLGDDHLICNYWFKDANSVFLIPERLYNYLEPDCSSKVRSLEPRMQLAQYNSVKNVKDKFKRFFDLYSNELVVELSEYDKIRMRVLVSICRIPSKELCSEIIQELIEEFGEDLIKEYSLNNNNVLFSRQ